MAFVTVHPVGGRKRCGSEIATEILSIEVLELHGLAGAKVEPSVMWFDRIYSS
jgi:hypothetical protein